MNKAALNNRKRAAIAMCGVEAELVELTREQGEKIAQAVIELSEVLGTGRIAYRSIAFYLSFSAVCLGIDEQDAKTFIERVLETFSYLIGEVRNE